MVRHMIFGELVEPADRGIRDVGVPKSSVPAPTDQPDDLLLTGLSAGDPAMTRAFIRRFQRTVFGVALGIIGDRGVAEDVAQQVFERAWRHAATYDPRRGSVRSWLIGIAHNVAVDTVRVRCPVPIETQALNALIAAILDTPDHHELADETSALLRQALTTLPAEQARAAILSAVHGLTAREIALFEAIPLGTAKSRIRAAFAKLHETMVRPATARGVS
jgi:RNA polymerase sigma factor (sigma-70 family)